MSINFLSHIYHLFFFSLISRLIPKGIYCRTMDRLMEVLKWVYMALFFFFVILQLDNFINPATLNLSLDKRFVETLPIRQTLIHRVDTPCQKEDSTVTKKLSASRAKTYVMKCSISLFCLKSLVNVFFYLLGYRYIFAVQLWSKRIAEQKWIWGLYHCLPAPTSCSSTVNFHRFRLQVGLVFVYFQTNVSHVSGWSENEQRLYLRAKGRGMELCLFHFTLYLGVTPLARVLTTCTDAFSELSVLI